MSSLIYEYHFHTCLKISPLVFYPLFILRNAHTLTPFIYRNLHEGTLGYFEIFSWKVKNNFGKTLSLISIMALPPITLISSKKPSFLWPWIKLWLKLNIPVSSLFRSYWQDNQHLGNKFHCSTIFFTHIMVKISKNNYRYDIMYLIVIRV